MKQVVALALLAVFITSLSLAESHQKADADTFTLTFQHASRAGVPQNSNSFAIDVNGKRLKEYTPTNYNVNSAT